MKDFTLSIYQKLLEKVSASGYNFQTLQEFTTKPMERVCILRHDVDRKSNNALKMAILESEKNIKSTYFFRKGPQSFRMDVVKKVIELDHEIGYHYENLCDTKGDFVKGIKDFERNLNNFRNFYPVKTVSMHGRPTSKWDSKLLWNKFDYKKFGIISEPYFDLDYDQVFYLTDAGRSWNNEEINLRDKVDSNFNFKFCNTSEIISALAANKLPDKIMFNIHPEHWSSSNLEWYMTYFKRKIKNFIKKILINIS